MGELNENLQKYYLSNLGLGKDLTLVLMSLRTRLIFLIGSLEESFRFKGL
jgi:hypothetical protein